ncbi:MAG TPA: hypothetical protein VG387_10880 [Rhizomicrobium sp.]|jgi:hypothetical protein|nr:hypothetical protein [Rhizomicrobium sp.]
MRALKNALCAMLFCAVGGCIRLPPVADFSHAVTANGATATVPVTLDDNRVFVEIAFVRPDGGTRKALAWINQGQGGLVLSNALYRELDPQKTLRLRIGTLDIAVDAAAVQPESIANDATISLDPFAGPPSARDAAKGPGGEMAAFAAPMPVEAILPPGLLQHFVVTFDYGAKTLTLAPAGGAQPEGTPVPIRVDPCTGFAMLDVTIDGTPHVFVLDDGGSYSGIRDADPLTKAHPDWLRASGGVGPANLVMQASDIAPVVKVPRVRAGALSLDDVGLIQMGSGVVGRLFFDRIYSVKAGETVDGMIGGNVLGRYRLTIDYPARMTYWQAVAPADTHDLDQVGLVLQRDHVHTTIAAVAQKNGTDTVAGVAEGDALLAIDGAGTATMTRGELHAALHGTPGTRRHLWLERDGRRFTVDVPVTAF